MLPQKCYFLNKHTHTHTRSLSLAYSLSSARVAGNTLVWHTENERERGRERGRARDSLVLARLTHLGKESLMRFLLVIKLNLFKPSYPTHAPNTAAQCGQRRRQGAEAGSRERGPEPGQARPGSCASVLALVTLVFGNNVAVRQPQDFSMGFRLLQVLPFLYCCPQDSPSIPLQHPAPLQLTFCIAFKVTVLLP